MTASPRNILLITADEMRGDAPAFMGNPDCQTPHLDRLAARGSVLENHFCVFPKCVPSRVSMHTGRYTHTEGYRSVMPDNHMPRGQPNFPEQLRFAHGYETAVFGLNHVWDDRWFYGDNTPHSGVVDYTSFTNGPLREMAKKPAHYPPRNPDGPEPLGPLDVDYGGCEEGVVEGFLDQNRCDQAIGYIEQLRDRSKPFFLQLNISKPHPSYAVCEPYFSMYDRARLTPFPHTLPTNATLSLRAQRAHRLGVDVEEAVLREIQAVYYGMCTFVDHHIGRVLDCLQAQGLEENTLVVFTSDHGDFAGQYGINEKWDTTMADCLLKVPLILAGPDIPQGQRFDGLTEHVDLPETFFDYLGLENTEPTWHWHGRSLLPVLEGAPGKDAVFADGGHEAPMRARFNRPVYQEKKGRRVKATGGKQLTYQEAPDAMARAKMIRMRDWKLVVRETGGNELYHLSEDPWELNNLYGQPGTEAVTLELQRGLLEWCLRTDTDRPYLQNVGA
ncbi:MAG: sulfatase-like hydrolase/transferase [Opitutales bacterium]